MLYQALHCSDLRCCRIHHPLLWPPPDALQTSNCGCSCHTPEHNQAACLRLDKRQATTGGACRAGGGATGEGLGASDDYDREDSFIEDEEEVMTGGQGPLGAT